MYKLTPIDYLSPVSTASSLSLSPISPIMVTPVSKVHVGPYSTTITTDFLTTPLYTLDVDVGMNDNYLVQKQTTEYFLYLILDKHLYTKDLCYLLKYLKIENDIVKYVESEEEYKKNKVCDDNLKNIEKKTDFIEEHILGIKEMRKLLQRIISELGYKWYDLVKHEQVVVDVVEKYLKQQLRKHVEEKK